MNVASYLVCCNAFIYLLIFFELLFFVLRLVALVRLLPGLFFGVGRQADNVLPVVEQVIVGDGSEELPLPEEGHKHGLELPRGVASPVLLVVVVEDEMETIRMQQKTGVRVAEVWKSLLIHYPVSPAHLFFLTLAGIEKVQLLLIPLLNFEQGQQMNIVVDHIVHQPALLQVLLLHRIIVWPSHYSIRKTESLRTRTNLRLVLFCLLRDAFTFIYTFLTFLLTSTIILLFE